MGAGQFSHGSSTGICVCCNKTLVPGSTIDHSTRWFFCPTCWEECLGEFKIRVAKVGGYSWAEWLRSIADVRERNFKDPFEIGEDVTIQ